MGGQEPPQPNFRGEAFYIAPVLEVQEQGVAASSLEGRDDDAFPRVFPGVDQEVDYGRPDIRLVARVVPAASSTTMRSVPASRFTMEDFPTLGRPSTAIRMPGDAR